MFKQKYLGFLLVGLALGIGLFLFIGYAISTDSSALSQDTEILEKQEKLSLDVVTEKTKTIQSIIQEEVGNKKDESLEVTKDRHQRLFEYRMQKMHEDRERKELGKQKLKELIQNQPYELNVLFQESSDPYDGQEYSYIDSHLYGLHLTEEVDDIWATGAELYLYNIFTQVPSLATTVYRVNCRSFSCEIAGTIQGSNTGNHLDAADYLYNHLMRTLSKDEGFLEKFHMPLNRHIKMQANKQTFPVAFTIILNRVQQKQTNP